MLNRILNQLNQLIIPHLKAWWPAYGLGLLAIIFILFLLKKIWSEI